MQPFHYAGTRVYNLIFFPQITRLLLGDATISSKTDPRTGSKMEKKSMVKLKNDKTMLKIFSFILNSVSKKTVLCNAFTV